MKVVILAGDLGTSLSEETNVDIDDLVEGFDCKQTMSVKQSVKNLMAFAKKIFGCKPLFNNISGRRLLC